MSKGCIHIALKILRINYIDWLSFDLLQHSCYASINTSYFAPYLPLHNQALKEFFLPLSCVLFLKHNFLLLWNLLTRMTKTYTSAPQEDVSSSSSRTSTGKASKSPYASECIPRAFDMNLDFKTEKPSPKPERCKPVSQCVSSISDVERVKADCRWGDAVLVEIPSQEEDIMTYKDGCLSVYTYLFTLVPVEPSSPPIDLVILDFCEWYRITLGQIHPSFWRIIYMTKYYVNMAKEMFFTLDHLIRMYSPWLFEGGGPDKSSLLSFESPFCLYRQG